MGPQKDGHPLMKIRQGLYKRLFSDIIDDVLEEAQDELYELVEKLVKDVEQLGEDLDSTTRDLEGAIEQIDKLEERFDTFCYMLLEKHVEIETKLDNIQEHLVSLTETVNENDLETDNSLQQAGMSILEVETEQLSLKRELDELKAQVSNLPGDIEMLVQHEIERRRQKA